MNQSIAVVTGSTSGIGLAIAEAFAGAGCPLVVNGIATAPEAEALTGRLRTRHGVDVLFHPADLAAAS